MTSPGAAAAERPARTAALLRSAEAMRGSGQRAGAEAAYREILAMEPTHLAALLGLAALTLEGEPTAALGLLRIAVEAHPTHAGAGLQLAEALRRAGCGDQAEAAYRGVLRAGPTHAAAALVGLARLARDGGRDADALDLFQQASRARPDSLDIRLEVAAQLTRLECRDEAEAAYREIVERAPDHLGALLALGHGARRRGDRATALAYFGDAVRAHPTHAGGRVEYAHALRDAGQYDEAEAAYGAVLAGGPAYAVAALLGLGAMARRRGDLERAGACYLRAATEGSGPAALGAWIEVAQVFRDAGRWDVAEDAYRAVIATPDATARQAASAWIGLGQLRRAAGDRDGALRCFEAARDALPGESADLKAAVALEIATEFRDRGRWDDAAALAEDAACRDPANLAARLAVALVARARGDRAAALRALQAAALAHPTNPQPWVEAALDHRALGDLAAAEDALARALALDPHHLGARLQRAEMLWLAEEFEASLHLCREIVADRPDCVHAPLGMARALASLGRHDAALKELDVAEARFGPQPGLALRRAEVLSASGDPVGADAVLEIAVKRWTSHPGTWVRRMWSALAMGDLHSVDAALAEGAARPLVTLADQAALAVLRGTLADARWETEAALAQYEEALRLQPSHAGAMIEAARACLLLMRPDDSRRHLDAALRAGAASSLLRGKSPRASRHHLGQILDEFRMDETTVRALRDATMQPPAERLGTCLAAVREAPDSTPAAMALLLSLRRAGRLHRPDAGGSEAAPGIPRRIGQYWDSTNPPEDVRALMRTWPAAHPGWQHAVFDDAAARDALARYAAAGVIGSDVPAAYSRATGPAQKADLFRLAWLVAEGGFWLDADNRCLGQLVPLARGDRNLVLYQEEYATLGNDVIGAAPRHPVLWRALAMGSEALNRGDRDVVWLSTGPGLLTRAFAQVLAEEDIEGEPWFGRCAVLERSELARVVARHCRVAYKGTSRHWLRALAGPGRHVREARRA
ncbi:tetratricopeptide repeat protein [Roseomonas sp. CCTCC AB2023176]|uniref:tetratricopeptide repeat protein n=1 Tax=Roseomonas sp. CCTCC AB2023176 TaxID=3342640 RepID=UPI0035D6FCD8